MLLENTFLRVRNKVRWAKIIRQGPTDKWLQVIPRIMTICSAMVQSHDGAEQSDLQPSPKLKPLQHSPQVIGSKFGHLAAHLHLWPSTAPEDGEGQLEPWVTGPWSAGGFWGGYIFTLRCSSEPGGWERAEGLLKAALLLKVPGQKESCLLRKMGDGKRRLESTSLKKGGRTIFLAAFLAVRRNSQLWIQSFLFPTLPPRLANPAAQQLGKWKPGSEAWLKHLGWKGILE